MQKQTTKDWFENITSVLIVAGAVGIAIVIPAVRWIVNRLGWPLPEPVQKLAQALGMA